MTPTLELSNLGGGMQMYQWELKLANLYDGTGEPCAGQLKLNGRKVSLKRLEVFDSTENLGADPPTGSEEIEMYKPRGWRRRSLSWTDKI